MINERVLDVSQLEPCEPMERILAAIPSLCQGEYLRVWHRMEPHPLYAILEREGFAWLTQPGQTVPVEIYIWLRSDAEAEAAVKTNCQYTKHI